MVLPNTHPAGEREERVNLDEGFLDADMLRNVAGDPSDYAAFVMYGVCIAPLFPAALPLPHSRKEYFAWWRMGVLPSFLLHAFGYHHGLQDGAFVLTGIRERLTYQAKLVTLVALPRQMELWGGCHNLEPSPMHSWSSHIRPAARRRKKTGEQVVSFISCLMDICPIQAHFAGTCQAFTPIGIVLSRSPSLVHPSALSQCYHIRMSLAVEQILGFFGEHCRIRDFMEHGRDSFEHNSKLLQMTRPQTS